MTMTATLSILGLYAYRNGLFDNLHTPEGIERETLISAIVKECAPFELLWPDWDTMRGLIGLWSDTKQWTWSELAKTLEYDYDAIANYDRREEWRDTSSGQTANKGAADGYTYGFNSENKARSNRSEDESETNAQTEAQHTGRVSGNIGVTSTQELIRQQRESVMYNIYADIANDFKKEFCILVY